MKINFNNFTPATSWKTQQPCRTLTIKNYRIELYTNNAQPNERAVNLPNDIILTAYRYDTQLTHDLHLHNHSEEVLTLSTHDHKFGITENRHYGCSWYSHAETLDHAIKECINRIIKIEKKKQNKEI